MELFWSDRISEGLCVLDADETAHCVRVLRHREGDEISIIDGEGTLYTCVLLDTAGKEARAKIVGAQQNWGSHPYHLNMAVCPTKNIDRYEWFAEKAAELGIDIISPVIGDHSERKVFKPERLKRILLSAAKQSLKAAVPKIEEAQSVSRFIETSPSGQDCLKLIACCFEGEAPRISINDALRSFSGREIIVLIGPEGDFSQKELELAVKNGFIPIHLGESRLRTETAALTSVEAVYLSKI